MNDAASTPQRGLLAWFASNRVAANLLMLLLVAAGLASLWQMRTELFPEVAANRVTVTVPYPGASPEEVEAGVVRRVEEAIAGIAGVDQLRAGASEGAGTVVARMDQGADPRRVVDEIRAAVDRITTLPDQAERPIITEVTNRTPVISIALFGNVPEQTLKRLAQQVQDELTAKPNITQVELVSARPNEIHIDVSETALRRHGLSFDGLVRTIGQASIEQPGGSIDTDAGETMIRTRSQRRHADEFGRIAVLTRADGTVLRLDQLATVTDGLEDTGHAARFNDRPAIMLKVFRVGQQDAVDVAEATRRYVAAHRGRLSDQGVDLVTWLDISEVLESRLELLVRNGMIGLVLVFVCLALFLDLRLAFWATLAIPVSFLGAFWLLPQFDVTINIISLFALILVLGIVVDDAVVVGENIFAKRQAGVPPLDAAITGVREIAVPVTIAVATTMIAFVPMLMTPGESGQLMRTLPLVVIAVLAISLIEAMLILPAHLATQRWNRGAPGPVARLQQRVRDGLKWLIEGPYRRLLAQALAWRYVTVAAAVGLLLLTAGTIQGGHLRFVFFPHVDADNVIASVKMPPGTPSHRTETVARELEAAARRVAARVDAAGSPEVPPLIRHVASTIGSQPYATLMHSGSGMYSVIAPPSGGHLAEVNIELLGADRRPITATAFAGLWREAAQDVPGISDLTFASTAFSTGAAVDVELSHHDFDQLVAAADQLRRELAELPGVQDVTDSFELGKAELQLALKPQAEPLGIREADLARQVHQGFHGAEVQRLQRGRDEVKVLVRYPDAERRSLANLEQMRIRLPDGRAVPLHTVATIEAGQGYAALERVDRRRVVSVRAEVDIESTSPNAVNAILRDTTLPALAEAYPALTHRFAGEQREQRELLESLALYTALALGVIFALLAIQFNSYTQPLIIMAVIPFGLIGAAAGHLIMGYDLSMFSVFGMVALSGVVVNNALILIDLANRLRTANLPLAEALSLAAMRRFRPILLTTLTTFFGLMPMILETSFQAQFLVPLAVSLGFGVLFATAITLLLVPALYLILADLHALVGRAEAPPLEPITAPTTIAPPPPAPVPQQRVQYQAAQPGGRPAPSPAPQTITGRR